MKADRSRLLVTAAAGIVAAHAADYALAYRDPARQLAATGHAYWPAAVSAAVVCGALAVAFAVRRGWTGAHGTASVAATARRLAAGQVALFAVVETVERVAVGVHPLPFLTSAAFALGLVLQVAVSVAVAIALRGVERAVARLAAALRRPRVTRSPAPSWRATARRAVVRWPGVAGGPRGPPRPRRA